MVLAVIFRLNLSPYLISPKRKRMRIKGINHLAFLERIRGMKNEAKTRAIIPPQEKVRAKAQSMVKITIPRRILS